MRIGDISAKTIMEIPRIALPATFMLEAAPSEIEAAIGRQEPWTAPEWFDAGTNSLLLSTHSWLLDTGRSKILIDPCVGNHKPRRVFAHYNMLDTPYLERMRAAGTRPEDIDFVFCTHLHVDHCGWNTRLEGGRWVPTFPRAQYLFSKIENDHWADLSARAPETLEESSSFGVYADSVQPVIDAGQARLLEGSTTIADCLTIEAGHGHTPGHLIATLLAGNEGALFAGDALHHQAQIVHPDWNTKQSASPEAALATRRRILSACADRALLLMAAHFMAPHFVRVRHGAQSGFVIQP